MSWNVSHLAKRPSDLKQNGTQEKTPFSGTVFHTLSHGVLRFVASVSFKNHWIEAPWLAVKEFQPVRRWFFELTLATKRITPCERAWKTVLENGVFSCVPFCLRSLGCFERCVQSCTTLTDMTFFNIFNRFPLKKYFSFFLLVPFDKKIGWDK